MSPIILRPIREQFEHDRVIRQLQARLRRRFSVAINPGQDETVSVRAESLPVYPDLVLTSTDTDNGRRHHGIVEVETTESVNHLEAVAEWTRLAKVRGAFYLYVPAGAADVARRLCEDNGIAFAEIWTYYAIGPQVRFSMVHRSAAAVRAAKARKARAATKATAARKTGKTRKASAKSATVSRAKRTKPAKKTTKAKTAKPAKKTTKAKTAKPAKKTTKAKMAKPAKASRKPATSTRSASRRTAKAVRKTQSSKAAASTRQAKRRPAKRSGAKHR